jgi:hypothetical protein
MLLIGIELCTAPAESAPSPLQTTEEVDPVSVRCIFSPITPAELRDRQQGFATKVAALASISPERVQIVQAPAVEFALIQSSEAGWALASSTSGIPVLIQIMPPTGTLSEKDPRQAAEILLLLKPDAWLQALGVSVSNVEIDSGVLGEHSLGHSADLPQSPPLSASPTAAPGALARAQPKTAIPSVAAPPEAEKVVRITITPLTSAELAARRNEMVVPAVMPCHDVARLHLFFYVLSSAR